MASRSSETADRVSRWRGGAAALAFALAIGGVLDARQSAAPAQRPDAARRAADRIRVLQKESEALVAQESAVLKYFGVGIPGEIDGKPLF